MKNNKVAIVGLSWNKNNAPNEYFYGYQKLKIENIRDNKRNYKVVTENSDK